MSFASVVYAVTVVSLPAGMSVDLTRSAQPMAAVGAPPAAIALSQSGSLAVVLSKRNPDAASLNVDSRILVVRGDGTRAMLKRPPDTILAKTFRVFQPGPSGEPTYPEARFAGVSLAADGTPFATVEYPFSGAYSGVEDAVYVWNGTLWRNAVPAGPLPIEATNFSAAFADSPSRFVCNGDYLNTFPILDEAESDPHYQENQALLVERAGALSLGFGAATAVRGAFVVGYTAGTRSVMMNQAQPPVPTALEWTGGRRAQLGPGIAYGVNEVGDAVGDDGRGPAPMLWHRGRAIRLSDAPGSAHAIASDGTIVGTIGDYGFIVRGVDANHKIQRIDALLRDPGWHINAAYSIAANGRILATGQRRSSPVQILLLDPFARPK